MTEISKEFRLFKFLNKWIDTGRWAKLSGTAGKVAIVLMRHWNPIKGAFPSCKTIIREARIGSDSVKPAIEELVAKGLITVKMNKIKRGYQRVFHLVQPNQIPPLSREESARYKSKRELPYKFEAKPDND